ncbi:MAG: ABC transporter substrate-binding protein [Syntrophales bacterium]|nr:ABC transporter substrate-binding protein [Syntrophales bacterium]
MTNRATIRGKYVAGCLALVGTTLLFLLYGTAHGELRTVSFLPHWIPQAQFAGYYVAQEKGFYKNHGIDVLILRGGPQTPVGEALKHNRVNFASLFLTEAIKLRDEGVRIVNLAQIVRRSGFMLVARKKAGIRTVTDLAHKKVALWQDFRVQPQMLFQKYQTPIIPVVQGTTVNLFLRGGVDATSAMWYNEYHTILSAGWNEEELTPFFFHKEGLNFPEDGIYVKEETLRRDPELCCRFAKASLEGWKYAFANPEEALDIVMRYADEAKTGTNRAHQRWMLNRLRELIAPADAKTPLGTLERSDYERTADLLYQAGVVKSIIPYGGFHGACTGRNP